jgi:predicted outer membrane protein
MRRLWMDAALLVMLAACRTEGTNDRALGTERKHEQGTLAREPSGADKRPGKSAERAAALVARILVMTQTIAEGAIEAAKLTEERGASPDVKAYAAKLASEQKQDLGAMTRLTQNKRIDLGATGDDPLIKARRAADQEKIERLSRLSGQAFDEEYMEGEPSEHALLSALAREGVALSKDNELSAFFRMIDGHAQDRRTRALGALPKLCAW